MMEIAEGYQQTEVGIIPIDWKVKQLGEIGQVSSGGTPNRSNSSYWNGSIPWITTTQIDFNTITHANEFITEIGLKNSSAKKYAQNTLLMAMYGQGKTRGKIAILGIDATINQACAAIILNQDISNKYIFFYLAYNYEAIRKLSNIGNQENLNGNIIKSIFLPLPTLPEQKAIAQSLSDADAAIAELDRLITKKRNIKQGTMQQLLTGKKRLPGFNGEWEVEKLDNISSEIGDGIHATPEYLESSEFYFINGNNLIDGSIKITERTKCVSEEEYRKYKLTLGNRTILMSINGTIGNIAFFNNEKVILGKSAAYINVKIYISKQYIFYFMQTHVVNCYFEDELTGSTIRNLSLKSIRNTPILLPQTIEEQEAIAQVLTDMGAEIEALEQKRDKYKAIKQGMMQELLTGRTRLI